MNAIEWIEQYETYLTLVKNRANNTVRSYILDAQLLYRFVTTRKLGEPRVKTPPLVQSAFDWATFTEDMAVDYVRELKKQHSDSTVQRRILTLRQFFKFLQRKGAVTMNPLADMETRAIRRKLPQTLTINEMNKLPNLHPPGNTGVVGHPQRKNFPNGPRPRSARNAVQRGAAGKRTVRHELARHRLEQAGSNGHREGQQNPRLSVGREVP